MRRPTRQAIVFCAVLTVMAAGTLMVVSSRPQGVDLGFWFDAITADTRETVPERLEGGITIADLRTIESMALSEIARAFSDFQVSLSGSRRATYRVRVVDSLRLPMAPRAPSPSGESRSIPGLGGQGAVNFRLLAHNAIAYAPPEADRAAIVAGIGRGIGRAAVHEFAHQILGSWPIHESRDVRSYEYRTAARAEQYYGEMHWGIARPLLAKRIGLRVRASGSLPATDQKCRNSPIRQTTCSGAA